MQPLNAFSPIDVTVCGIVISLNDDKFSNAFSGMIVAPSAMTILERFVHPFRRSFVIPFRTDGIVTSVSDEQFMNAFSPIELEEDIVSLFSDLQPLKHSVPTFIRGEFEGYSASATQFLKAPSPRDEIGDETLDEF